MEASRPRRVGARARRGNGLKSPSSAPRLRSLNFYYENVGGYAAFIHAWERRLAARDRDKVPGPFAWGWDWLAATPGGREWGPGLPPPGPESPAALADWSRRAIARSDEFFSYAPPREFRLEGEWLSFASAAEPPPGADGDWEANRTAYARWFAPPAEARRAPNRAPGRAVVVLPQWNADIESHVGLCRWIQSRGIAALRLSLPYHDRRRPAHLRRAEYTVDGNLGRTIHAARQAVCDARACLDWLETQGCERLGLLGTSLGSCYAFLAAAHDRRPRARVFNHVSAYFGDVVWTGLTTQHVRASVAEHLNQDQLRAAWSVISPASYYPKLVAAGGRSLLLCARHDLSFRPEFSRQVLADFRRLGAAHEARWLPCGHYTLGKFPFSWLDGWRMLRFLEAHL